MVKWKNIHLFYRLIGVAIILVIINIFSNHFFKHVKIDMTADQLYTLSDGTKSIISDLKEPIQLKFYFSEKLFSASPSVATYGNRVKELLEQYAALSHDKINLQIINPEPFSDNEAEAMHYRLQGIPVDNAGSLAYFGLTGINTAGEWKSISYFQTSQEEVLEYELSKLVYNLTNVKRPVIGLLSKLPIDGTAANAYVQKTREWFILSQLKRSFDVQHLATDIQHIPETINTLMVVHPRQLPEKTLFAIDQFVLNGGRTLMFVDAFSEADVSVDKITGPIDNYSTPIRDSIPEKLFDAWGIELVKGFVAGDRRAATRIKARIGGLEKGEVDYVAWLTLGKDNYNSTDVVSRNLQNIVMASSGVLRKTNSATTEFRPLITTSDQSMAIDASSIQFFTSPEELLQMYVPGGEPFVLAARLTGSINSAFPNGLKSEKNDNTTESKHTFENRLLKSAQPANLIIVADTDMLRDLFWVDFQDFYGQRAAMPRADNDKFVINALENLSGSNELINLRSRGRSVRPFIKVAELRAAADQEYRIKERVLQEKLSEVGYKIKELQKGATNKNGQPHLNPQQLNEINKFRAQHITIRKELRNVQHALSKEIETLGSKLKIINISLIPLIIIIVATILGIVRMKQENFQQKNN